MSDGPYDAENRLTSESGSSPWSETENYDAFGNRWVTNYSSTLPALTLETATAPSPFNASNRDNEGTTRDSLSSHTTGQRGDNEGTTRDSLSSHTGK